MVLERIEEKKIISRNSRKMSENSAERSGTFRFKKYRRPAAIPALNLARRN